MRRHRKQARKLPMAADGHLPISDHPPLLENQDGPDGSAKKYQKNSMSSFVRRQPVWLLLAVASGACAAFNGVFAKLTTTTLTSSLAASLANTLHLPPNPTEYALRTAFFGMNLLFNVAMWTLFTAALTRATSTTRVSIVNVSANFFVTAMLGWMIFAERLPWMWWIGAALLGAGNVVIGRREQDERKEEGETRVGLLGEEAGRGESAGTDEAELISLDLGGNESTKDATKRGEEADDPIP